MRSRCPFPSGLKITISSIRLMNSGRNAARNASNASLRARSGSRSANSKIAAEPTLLVMTRTVVRKSTVRPFLLVSRPSSRICSIELNTLLGDVFLVYLFLEHRSVFLHCAETFLRFLQLAFRGGNAPVADFRYLSELAGTLISLLLSLELFDLLFQAADFPDGLFFRLPTCF